MRTGLIIAGLFFIGGVLIIWSLFSPSVNTPLMVAGILLLLGALGIFVKELMKI